MTRIALPSSLLLDTGVWLDNYLGSRPGSTATRKLVVVALKHDVTLLHTVTAVKDIHHIVAQTLTCERRATGAEITQHTVLADDQAAWACVQNMGAISTAVGIDASDLWLAEKYRAIHGDIDGNLAVAAARRSNASILVTNDAALIHHAPVVAMTPSDVLELFNL